jgi:hypothetical protein
MSHPLTLQDLNNQATKEIAAQSALCKNIAADAGRPFSAVAGQPWFHEAVQKSLCLYSPAFAHLVKQVFTQTPVAH